MKRDILDFVSLRESKQSLATRILQWRNRARSRHQLLDLDDRMLNDIGLTRYDVLHSRSLFSDLVRHPE
jgi:uncharacterized protein YjiS (DUF1127 family)